MKIEKNIDLYKYSTMRTHSLGSIMYTPESIDELRGLLITLQGDCYFIGGGSNVIFASNVKKPIVNLMQLNNGLKLNDDGTITSGCSVRIQKLINFGLEHSLGGFEYLYSLPASVGGVVYMNAGRGKGHNQQISDWLTEVEYLDISDMQVKKMIVDKGQWTYRISPFQRMKAVILSATFRMRISSKDEIYKNIQSRKELVKKIQEGDKPSCGSVFNCCNKYIMRLIRGRRIGGACWARKTNNWISNDRNGTADDVIALINAAKKLHRLTFQKYNLEIRIFE